MTLSTRSGKQRGAKAASLAQIGLPAGAAASHNPGELGSSRESSMREREADFGFAAECDVPIPYMKRTREYYLALGYGEPYRWAHYAEVPFRPLAKPLYECRLALVTTAAPFESGKGDQGPGAAYNAAVKFYRVYSGETDRDHDVRISHLGYDRAHTKAEDANCWFPLAALRGAAAQRRIAALTPHFHGLPTNRSHRVTIGEDCPELLARCRAESADAAILVAV
jgi:Glycine/sarcosine/betaine reductase selenoprotein B (GRDB)